MPAKRPSKTDRMIVARHIRAEATMMRSNAEQWRANPDAAGVLVKMAAQQEERAERLERVADWMVDL